MKESSRKARKKEHDGCTTDTIREKGIDAKKGQHIEIETEIGYNYRQLDRQ